MDLGENGVFTAFFEEKLRRRLVGAPPVIARKNLKFNVLSIFPAG